MSPAPKHSPSPDVAVPEVVKSAPQPIRHWIRVVFLAILFAAGASFFLLRSHRPASASPMIAIRTAKASRGILLNTLRLSGSIAASRYADIIAPQLQAPDQGRGMVLLYLPPNGAPVKEGEVIAEIDGQAAKDHLDDVQARVDQGEMDLLKLRADQAAQMESVRQRVRVARGALEKAQQDVLAAAVRNKIDQELLKLAVIEAEANYDAAAAQVARYQESQAAALRVAELNQESQVRHRNRHRQDIERLIIKAPMDGRAVVRPIYRHGEQAQVQVGDELYAGQMFMRVVDASEMRLETSMNQAESELVRVGQRALIRFDAYPEIRLNGKVEAVGTIAAGGRRVNYYIRRVPVRISIQESDPRVLPDLTASADVVIAEEPDSIIVPREAVVEEDGKSVVYVRQAGAFSAREVELGLASNTEVAVRSGLQAGDEVALDRP